ncbi:hypothetical protein EJ065_1917 [Corallococcus coralloides]|uniref:Uncharacterized protein n=1 Tax=Corallococcus coralloides TaxID=184914 RepID=A0A410RNJ8_CORCK|nr:hypothetical protein [Corallococcus coralloides]QAT83509.1 hypothetical protein EJ065_1917 [Corallococcus coralloides]
MPRFVLIGAEPFPFLRELLRAEALRAGAMLLEVSAAAWGSTTTPWLELKAGRFRAGLLDTQGPSDTELTGEDVLWCLTESSLPPAPNEYLRAEHEALRDGFHTCCPARSLNRRGLLAPLWTQALWRLLAQRLPARGEASVLFPPRFHLGPRPEDGRRWKPWPREAEVSFAQVWWTLPPPGPLHLALVAAERVSLWRLEDGKPRLAPPLELEADLLQLARDCGGDFLEVLLVPRDAADTAAAPWTALQLSTLPEEMESMLAEERPEAREHLEHFARALLAGREDAR